jgi:hypothetical protein
MLTERQAAELYHCMDASLERTVAAKCSAGIVPGVEEAAELAKAALYRGYLEWTTNAKIAAGPKGAADVRPTVVCLCGSTRFREEYALAFRREEHAGRIALSVPCYKDDPCCKTKGEQDLLDRLHFAKIDMADEILVLDINGYIGDSTRREIAHATATGKRVRYASIEWEAADVRPNHVEGTQREVPVDLRTGAGEGGSNELYGDFLAWKEGRADRPLA